MDPGFTITYFEKMKLKTVIWSDPGFTITVGVEANSTGEKKLSPGLVKSRFLYNSKS